MGEKTSEQIEIEEYRTEELNSLKLDLISSLIEKKLFSQSQST